MTDPLLPTLRSLHLLEEFPDDQLLQLAGICRTDQIPAGAVIFRQGDEGSTIYFVCEGTVSLEICAPGVGCRRILTVAPGELLGWSPLLGQERMTATARTLSASKVIAVDARQILAICNQNPRFGYEFMKRTAKAIAQRLNATRLQLLDVYGGEMTRTNAFSAP